MRHGTTQTQCWEPKGWLQELKAWSLEPKACCLKPKAQLQEPKAWHPEFKWAAESTPTAPSSAMLRAGNTRWAQTEEIQHCQQPDVNNSSRHVWTFPALCLKLATAPLFTPYLLSPPCDSRLKITPSAGRRAVPSMPTLKAPLGVTAPPPLLAQRSHTGPPAGAGTQRAPRGYRARRGSPPGAERSTAVSTLPSPQRPPLGPGAAPAELSAGSGRRERRSRAGFQVGSDEAARPRAEQSNSALLRDGRGAARTHRRSVPALRGRPRRRGSVTARSVLTPEAPLTARGERLRLRAPPGMTPPRPSTAPGRTAGLGSGGIPTAR